MSANSNEITDLIADLYEDIETGLNPFSSSECSLDAATKLAAIGESAVDALAAALPRTSYAHVTLGMIGGEAAFKALCSELDTGNWRRIAAAARALAEIGDIRALDFLRPHAESNVWELANAIATAMAQIERTSAGAEHFKVDRDNPYDQVLGMWNDLTSIQHDDALRSEAIKWYHRFIEALPQLRFSSNEQKGDAFAMLGTVIYYLLHPDHSDFYDRCPEAAFCYEQCLKFNPQRTDVNSFLKEVR